tara:strand:- start:91 stop:1047 length:957 start_codon:yes stop_codon:yes gene_type:complete
MAHRLQAMREDDNMLIDSPSMRGLEVIRSINDGNYKVEIITKDELKTYRMKQIRYITDPDLARYITDQLDDNDGNLDMTDPIIVFIDREGNKVIIGGNHTRAGILSSKKATSAKVINLGNLYDEGWSDAEVRMLGILLNPKPKKRRNPSSNDDFVKTLVNNFETDGILIEDPHNLIFLMQAGCSSRECTAIISKAKDAVDKINVGKMLGGVWKKWDPRSIESQETIDAFSDSKSITWMMTSKLFDWRKIMDKVFANMGGSRKNLRILIHHPTPDAESKWINDVKPMHTKLLDTFLVPAGYTYELIELATIISETESVI